MTETITTPQAGHVAGDRVRRARAFLARVSRGVPTPPLAALVTARGPVTAAEALRADPRAARVEYGVTVTDGDDDRTADDLDRAARAGARLLVPEDHGWPTGAVMGWHSVDGTDTAEVEVMALWVRGPATLTGGQRLTVVGARAATDYGTHVARDWAAQLTEGGVTIVTGGALGIDAAATRGALAADGAPIVVLPCGIDRAHPAAHAHLLDTVAARGAVVTPFPPGQTPTRAAMQGRMRTLAGLGASGLLVVEAGPRSSALHAAHVAHRHGRPVMVVPGPVTSVVSAGAHQLAREPWARLVATVADVHADLTPETVDVVATVRGTLAATIRELCTELGVRAVITDDATAARDRWHQARVVLTDEQGARELAAHGLPRRDRVNVVCEGDPPAAIWAQTVAVGGDHVVSLPDGTAWLRETLAAAAS